ncbi:hypothetical protein BU679_02345 [Staphylococcus chromogenes]|uniref:hypothetical protein n=1 Tax=Staphylococcus chromogenes TaxID=46126 RepID=UPI000D19CB7C|nr:hypothetical protein [Staphylococcus chromogenes]MCE4966471.1 hypothetical protein [Staphylococcus chromogenes]PTF74165.1 hypothetical protein BUX97_11050 [Staphylococcus chromogenes]PTG52593.1 hypothetical protein BU679_02345 [Staphylococcus chromogenes]
MKTSIISKLLLSATILTGSLVGVSTFYSDSTQAAETQKSSQGSGEFKPINDSQANITLNKGVSYEVSDNGSAKLVDDATGKTEILPSEATDKNGNSVVLVYEENGNDLKVNVIDKSTTTQTRGWKEGLKCGLGTAGGAGLGGLTGASAGSVVPAIGTAGGGVIGAVSGGMSGAAASCF